MHTVRVLVLASFAFVLGSEPLAAQSLSRYRAYALESNLSSIVQLSGAKQSDVKTLHSRPAVIQQVEWRAPYVPSSSAAADPVRTILFSFYEDQLYGVAVTYEHDRMEGLTDSDVIASISAAYGGALPMRARPADTSLLDMPRDTTVIARWDDGMSVLTLLRGSYSREFQLVLMSKQLSARARAATREAVRLDVRDAPQVAADQRAKHAAEARVANDKARAANKAGFRP